MEPSPGWSVAPSGNQLRGVLVRSPGRPRSAAGRAARAARQRSRRARRPRPGARPCGYSAAGPGGAGGARGHATATMGSAPARRGSATVPSAMLMLEHKRLPYRRVDVLALAASARGAAARLRRGGETRDAGGRRTLGAPRSAIASGPCRRSPPTDERISTNRRIARFLDERHPEPPLSPPIPSSGGPSRRPSAGRTRRFRWPPAGSPWRRAVRDPAGLSRATADGRMGYLLYRASAHAAPDHPADRAPASSPPAAATDDELLAELPRDARPDRRLDRRRACSAERSRTPRTSWSRRAWR